MDIFALTKTPLFSKLREGLYNETKDVDVQEFLLTVHEVTNDSTSEKTFVLDALIIADIEFKQMKTTDRQIAANRALASLVEKAHSFVLHKIEECRANLGNVKTVPTAESLSAVNLTWVRNKSEFSALCYALKVGECFGKNISQADIVRTLSKAFNVEVTPDYAKKRMYESKMSTLKRKTGVAFLERLVAALRNLLCGDEEYDCEDEKESA